MYRKTYMKKFLFISIYLEKKIIYCDPTYMHSKISSTFKIKNQARDRAGD